MILNEQIMSQLDQNFEELVRFTKIVAEEPELIQKIDQYMSEPNGVNQLVQDAIRNQQSQRYDQYSGESPG